MHKEWSRFKSFEHFPIESNARPLRLAQNGFYYHGNGEEAKCAFCGVVNDTWAEGETVNEIHARLSRACPFVSGQDTANVPIHAEESLNQQSTTPSLRTRNSNNSDRSSIDNNHLTASDRSKTANESDAPQQAQRHGGRNTSHDSDTTSTTSPSGERCYVTDKTKYPQYSSRETRLESFTSWSYSHIVQPQDLSDAGLFFVGKYHKTCLILLRST